MATPAARAATGLFSATGLPSISTLPAVGL
jgi:hypothetical protein